MFTRSPALSNEPSWLPEIPPLVPPKAPLPEVPPVVTPMIYVSTRTQWEYKLLSRNLTSEEAPSCAELNSLGQEGWELAGVTTAAPLAYFYFKRLVA